MFLRSSRHLKGLNSDIASKAMTRKSGTTPADLLEPIEENSSFDSYCTRSSRATSKINSSKTHSMEKDASIICKEKFTKNLFGNSLKELNFNVTLEF